MIALESKSLKKPVRTTIYLPEDLHAELRIEAIRQHISMSKLIIRAIERELQRMTDEREKQK